MSSTPPPKIPLSKELEPLENLPLNLQVEVARTETPLRQIMAWKQGALLEFKKVIGEPVNILLGNSVVARGEVVVVNDHYGVRINEIVAPGESASYLKK